MEKLIIAKDIHKEFLLGEVKVVALDDVSFDIYKGELVVILGPSGSGKSTLLNILGGIETVSGGSISYNGIDLSSMNENELTAFRRANIGFIFQFYNLMPNLNALENVELAAELSPNPLDPKELLTQVGLWDRRDHYPGKMSGGQQQRVLLARALMAGQRLMILDEPVTGLDPQASQNMYDIINGLNKVGMTIVMISHDLDEALGYATNVLYIGKKIFFGATEEYKRSVGIE